MNAHSKKSEKKPTFIETYRRQHIIESASRVIAELGYVNTSLADIAKEAEISKGVISYYFKGKDDLIEMLMARMMDDMHEFIKVRVNKRSTVLEKLRTYVTASLDFVYENSVKFKVISDLSVNAFWKSHDHFFGQRTYQRCRNFIEKILSEGQENGEFGQFNVLATAAVIQGAIDGLALQWIVEPDNVDLDECKQKLMEILDRYIESEPCQ
ncbi:MAG: TetR/AcrR family transcriptional regulator [Desulfobacterales bacterium]|nr:TetR/AcrR family transcriptional regulator [Desulfobacterales bacterium]